nr:retrovirus-related Pol polyprotein from transposon TNT 1-94 [Tanacetum cinerariifolium]
LEVLPADMEGQTKAEQNKKSHNAMILCLGNKVLREVTRETTAAGVWLNLQTLYMTKSLANKLYLKKKLHTFYMPAGRKISEHIDEFNKLVPDLSNIEDHLKRNCPTNNRRKLTGYVKKDEQPRSSGLTYDDSEVMSAQARALLDWIMDSGCSYHMTTRLDIFFDFLECDGGSVQLGDNRECKIRGELNASVKEKDSLAQVESLGGKRYFLSIVNDYSRRVWVYILRFKHEAFGKFKEWKHFVENQTWRTVKKLRTDNGLEFCNWEFEQLCIESGIARHLTVAGMPQQNRVAEHINIALMDK